MGIASMVIGIIAIILGLVPYCGTIALIPAIVGLILGAVDMVQKKKQDQPRGMAIAGLVLNIITVVWISFWWLAPGILGLGAAAAM